jgi:hypothetical protein
MTSSTGIDRSHVAVAITLNAQATSEAESLGVQHNEASIAALAAYRMPAGTSRVATTGGLFDMGGVGEAGAAALGPVAVATTDQGYLAASVSNGMPLANGKDVPGTARANTRPVFEPQHSHGVGKSKMVQVASVGLNSITPNSFAMSEMGDGPHAISEAGFAVSGSYSSKDTGEDGGSGGASAGNAKDGTEAQFTGPSQAADEHSRDGLGLMPAASRRLLAAAGGRAGAASVAASRVGVPHRKPLSAAAAADTADTASGADAGPWSAPGGGIYNRMVTAQALGATNSDLYAALTIDAPPAVANVHHAAGAGYAAAARPVQLGDALRFLPAASRRLLVVAQHAGAASRRLLAAAGGRAGAASVAASRVGMPHRKPLSAAAAADTADTASGADAGPWSAPGGGIYNRMVTAQALGATNSDLYAALTIDAPPAVANVHHAAGAGYITTSVAGGRVPAAPQAASGQAASGQRLAVGSAFFDT